MLSSGQGKVNRWRCPAALSSSLPNQRALMQFMFKLIGFLASTLNCVYMWNHEHCKAKIYSDFGLVQRTVNSNRSVDCWPLQGSVQYLQ